ncbi:transcriptional regulator [Caballeronia sordidicola]|uniref:Transcriptional regulator n=1 Tax=Caballeronia sordidicola TaxID=196367 RepID=A0A158GRQ9_CABSO|nr:helix-turn-helix domain-containing protein [Caballeronia sordidicola]SAL34521.1 transcriptional regulator [Caballeronia sordidicola]
MKSNFELPIETVPLSELVRRGELLSADCPSREVLKHVTSRWGVLVLMVLLDEKTCRFSDLRRKVDGVSEKMLAQTLQWLAADGFVVRTSYDVVPPHVDYRLTPLGDEVARQVSSLADWIEVNLSRILSARTEPANASGHV